MSAEFALDQDDALDFMVAAGLVDEIVAAVCSSPQTAEINADKRSDTLMKWVKLGLVQAGFFVLVAAFISRRKKWPAIIGGGLAGGLLAAQYVHALKSGLESGAPGTENW